MSAARDLIVDLFAGPGGWSEGLRMLGLADVGIEWDDAACRTRAAAGHLTIRADVAQYPPEVFAGKVTGLIASPPCQDFSLAGKQAGRSGEKGQLIDTVPVWVDALRPEWIACEQVPPALPVWEEFAHLFRSWGYSVWCGVLNAADFGVPQTRQRAFLLASRVSVALPPEPTHQRHPRPSLFGAPRQRWLAMEDVLPWVGEIDRRTNSKDGRGGMVPTVRVPTTRPAPTVTGGVIGQWLRLVAGADADGRPKGHRVPRSISEPAPTLAFGHDFPSWKWKAEGEEAVPIEAWEAGVLQSFSADYPWRGGKGKQAEQIGNAVPPLLAAHVLAALTGQAIEAAA